MQRIILIGTSGSGKTTLAKNISSQLGYPAYDLDDYYWLPHWQPKGLSIFQHTIHDIIKQPQWVISGNYSAVRNLIWTEADTIIWLNYSFSRCFYQALIRSLKRIIFKTPCCNGNYESLRRTFLSKNSLLLWIIKSHWRYQHEYATLLKSLPFSEKCQLILHNPQETQQWLNSLST